jgi:hypothetical protein
MKLTITRIEPTTQISQSGKKKYYVYTGDGDRHIAWGDWITPTVGKEVDVLVKKESFKGNDYSVIWPTKDEVKETAIASDVAIKSRPRPLPNIEPDNFSKTTSKIFDKRDRLMAKESALKSASQVWTTRVEARIDNAESEDPLEMAKRFYRWILSED